MASKPAAQTTTQPDHLSDDPFQLYSTLKQFIQPQATLLLALSGGVDSVVLLHRLQALTQSLHFDLHAMHVHHSLSQQADQWAAHCQWLCQSLNVPLTIHRAQFTKQGLGVEAAARQARYTALEQYQYDGKSPDYILTAHHQADQAETVLLQLCRGAGAKGLSAMPVLSEHKRLLRPMLCFTKQQILAYAKQHQLRWVEDESNHALVFDRNFIRHQVMPLLATRYPSIEQTLATAAKHMADADHLNTSLAQIDSENCIEAERIRLAPLQALSLTRRYNVMRYWFACLQVAMPSAVRLQTMVDQLFNSAEDANVKVSHGEHYLMRYDGYAYLVHVADLPLPDEFSLHWQQETFLALPNGYVLEAKAVLGQGIASQYLANGLSVKSRHAKVSLKVSSNRPSKSLKQLFQAAKIPPWQRAKYPVLMLGETVLGVPTIGYNIQFAAGSQERGFVFNIVKKTVK